MTEEENQIEDSYSTVRRPPMNKHSQEPLQSKPDTNNSSVGSLASSGLVVWDIFRETVINRTRRQHSVKSKDNNDHHMESGKRQSDTTISNPNAEREAAAIAVLENVIDNYKSRTADNSTDSTGPITNKVSCF
jgi:hypothetical protein